jgi:hypothetical protein
MYRCSRPLSPSAFRAAINRLGDGGLADEPVSPDMFHEFGLGDHPVAVLHQISEHGEDLRLHRTWLAVPPKLEQGGIELERVKREDRHFFILPLKECPRQGASIRVLHGISRRTSGEVQADGPASGPVPSIATPGVSEAFGPSG